MSWLPERFLHHRGRFSDFIAVTRTLPGMDASGVRSRQKYDFTAAGLSEIYTRVPYLTAPCGPSAGAKIHILWRIRQQTYFFNFMHR